jgi:hypothetical protein
MKALFKCTYDSSKKKLDEMYKIHFFEIFKRLHPQEKCEVIEYIQFQLQKEYDINKELYYDELNSLDITKIFYKTKYSKITKEK